MGRDVVLGGYAAKTCPVRVQWDFDPFTPTVPWVPSPEVQLRLDAGVEFEAGVFADMCARLGSDCVMVNAGGSVKQRREETLTAMDDRVNVILGAVLPDDIQGCRTGRPDVLVRHGHGYLPVDVKHHRHAVDGRSRTQVTVSSFDRPWDRSVLPGWSSAVGENRAKDTLQLAHYTRMLQACGRHPGDDHLWGGIIGTAGDWVVWHRLDEPLFPTYSRSSAGRKATRTALERYDHEHDFRVTVARRAASRRSSTDLDQMVVPVGSSECDGCPYDQVCADLAGPADASFAVEAARLPVQDWLALRRRGLVTVDQLASLNLDPVFLDDYLADVKGTPQEATKRLEATIMRAQMIRDGVQLVRRPGSSGLVPSADVEVDVDMESDPDGRVYLWGVHVRRRGDTNGHYQAFVDWTAPFTDDHERQLAARYAAHLAELTRQAETTGATISIFHWSHPETSKLKAILGADTVADLIGRHIDLRTHIQHDYDTVSGSGLKKVAHAVGFTWRVSDPGGATSQVYLKTARTTDDPACQDARDWLVSYNTDDVRATVAIRDALNHDPDRWQPRPTVSH